MNNSIESSKAPEPVGLYPHARRVGNLLFLNKPKQIGQVILKVLHGILWLDGDCHEKTPGWKHTIKFSANIMEECLDLPKVGRFPGWICD